MQVLICNSYENDNAEVILIIQLTFSHILLLHTKLTVCEKL